MTDSVQTRGNIISIVLENFFVTKERCYVSVLVLWNTNLFCFPQNTLDIHASHKSFFRSKVNTIKTQSPISELLQAHYRWREKALWFVNTQKKAASLSTPPLHCFISSRHVLHFWDSFLLRSQKIFNCLPLYIFRYILLFPVLQSISIESQNCKYVSFFICFLETLFQKLPLLLVSLTALLIFGFGTGDSVIRSLHLRNQRFNSPVPSSLLSLKAYLSYKKSNIST